MTVTEKGFRLMDRVYLKARHPSAWRVETTAAADFGALRGHKYCLLTTFRRSGEEVPTPVWFGLGEGKLYVRSAAWGGKVKRIKNDPRVQVAPCTLRGKPLGPAIEGRARILAGGEEEGAEAVLRSSYGLGRRIYEAPVGPMGVDTTYIEIAPIGGSE